MKLHSRVVALRNLAYDFVRDPIEGVGRVEARIAERSERHMPNGFMPWPACPYAEDEGWEERLHAMLGVPWPCPCSEAFHSRWRSVMVDLEALNLGRGAFGGWGDGEPGLVRAAWIAVWHLRPATVVETGVGRGLTTRFILEALEKHGFGHLWSIDLPPPRSRDLQQQVAIAVPERLRVRWSYVRGSSRRRLPRLLREVDAVDVFIHDSRHSERNLLFELRQAWSALRPGGIAIADDVDLNCGFHTFKAEHAGVPSLICPAEPIKPDLGRQGDRGVFAIVAKPPSTPAP